MLSVLNSSFWTHETWLFYNHCQTLYTNYLSLKHHSFRWVWTQKQNKLSCILGAFIVTLIFSGNTPQPTSPHPPPPSLRETLKIIYLIFSGTPIPYFFTIKFLYKNVLLWHLAIISSFLSWRGYFHTWIVNWISNFFSNCDRNMCSVLIKFLVTMFINLIFNYVCFEIGPITLDLLILVNCLHHENICEFTPQI